MSEPKPVIGYLLCRHVRILGANSLSSPITYGFPAVTGFLGAFHAISRKLQADASLGGLSLGGVLLACHDCEPHTYRTSKYSDFTFNQTRNPIKKDGKTASIIEEGKCHLTMSFVVEILGDEEMDAQQQAKLVSDMPKLLMQHRMAGGSVHGMARVEPVRFIKCFDIDTVIPFLMPAFVLMDAQDDFADIIAEVQAKNPEATPIDALLDVCTLHHIPEAKTNGDVVWRTESCKTGRGWLVPIPIGYQGISPLYEAGVMQEVRNPEYPSQYVEAIYGLGKWVYPHHLSQNERILDAFWRYQYDAEQALYRVSQENPSDF